MQKIRVHLRHTGSERFQFGVQRRRDGMYNVYLGRLFLAVRDCTNSYVNAKDYRFFDLTMGRDMLKNQRLRESMTAEEIDLYYNHNPEHYRLDYFLKLIRSK